jgi:large subunit ribosomal protein L18
MENANKIKRQKRTRRKIRVRAKIKGTAQRPRLSVFRSNKHIYLQLIDDEKNKTLVSMSDILPKRGKKSRTKTAKTKAALEAGKNLAELAKKKKITGVVFDRGGYAYHGRIKAAADGAREGGLKF